MGNTAVFVGINAIVEPAHKAVVVSGLFLSTAIGMITGIAITSALMLDVMQRHLNESLLKLGLSLAERLDVSPSRSFECVVYHTNHIYSQVISKAAENVGYIYKLHGPVSDAVAGAYVDGLRWGYGTSFSTDCIHMHRANT
jgi:hypothetical protein